MVRQNMVSQDVNQDEQKPAPRRPTSRQVARMMLFLGRDVSEVVVALGVQETTVRRQLDGLVKDGVGELGDDGKLETYDTITTSQAEMVSCISQRRIRALMQDDRIKSTALTARMRMVDSESLKEFLRKPRGVGFAGQRMLHGKDWVHPMQRDNGTKKRTKKRPLKKKK